MKIKNNNGLTAIYVRRSVSDKEKGNNSLSIDAQREECIRFVGADSEYRIYCDDGKSGKDVQHRPAFQQMMSDAREGQICRIIVKKYDRFSRNMREYLNITDELDKLGVSVYSLSEPFNTETKEGRMMRNNLLNFAEFERETIAARVADAYNTKARETGFYQGGKKYYGYKSERRTINGKTGSVLVPNEQAESIQIAYRLYQKSDVSLNDVIKYFKEHNIVTKRSDHTGNQVQGNMNEGHITQLLQSPLYVRADKDVYAYFLSQGYEIIDDIEDYNGIYGVFIHTNSDGSQYVKLGYHEGLVDAKTWLAVQDKKSHNIRYRNNAKVKNSWLVGLAKCKHCGYALLVRKSYNKTRTRYWRYLVDFGFRTVAGCKRNTIATHPDEVEEIVLQAMRERIATLSIEKHLAEAPDSETEQLKAEILRCDDDIHKLMDKLPDADEVVFDYIQQRIKAIHESKTALEGKLQKLARKQKQIDTAPLEEPMARWDSLTVEEKHELAVMMIDVVYVSDETGIEIKFSI